MTTPTRLSLYNGALAVIGSRRLATVDENVESRRALDDIWNRGAIDTCLAAGLWNFASRGIQWNYDPDFTPPFGFQCAYQFPQDWIRWVAVCVDPYMYVPLLQYTDEGEYFFCDLQMLWVKYVSNDPGWGMNFSFWPDSFQRYVESYMGEAVALRLTGSEDIRKDAEAKREMYLRRAKSTDAMNEATAMLPAGNWRQARHGRRRNLDRGNPYQLIG